MHSKSKNLGLKKGLLFFIGKPQNSPRSIANGGESPLMGGLQESEFLLMKILWIDYISLNSTLYRDCTIWEIEFIE